MHCIDVVVAPEPGQQTRQRGLIRQALGQWCHPEGNVARQASEWGVVQRVGIAQVHPTHGFLQYDGT